MKRLAIALAALTLVASCGGGTEPADDATTDAPDSTETSTTVGSESTGDETTTSSGDVDQTGGATSMDSPIPVGEEQTIGDFTVSIVGWERDATQAVLDESEFNQPPEDGYTFGLATLRFRYNGTDTADPWVSLMWGATGDSGVDHTGGSCITYPDSMFDVGDMTPGDEGESNVCLTVATDDDNLVFWMHPTVSTGERTYFQLP